MDVNYKSSERIVVAEMISHLLTNIKEADWDQARYNKWLQGEIPGFGKLQGDVKAYDKRAVIG